MQKFKLLIQLTLITSMLCFLCSAFLGATAEAGTFSVDSRRDIAMMKRKIRASQFLQRATFGPTIEAIDELAERMQQIGVSRACSEWIDNEFDKPVSTQEDLALAMIEDDGLDPTQDFAWIQRYRYHAWWHNALAADDQLRQRVAWALAQIVVTSDGGNGFNDRNVGDNSGVTRWLGPTNYYDMLLRNSFGNYRDLLTEATYHPIMGVYLSHMRNRKTDVAANRFPDENYAREIMQLFSIGLYELHSDGRLKTDANGDLIPTYDNDDIKEFAKVFTGLAYKPNPNATGTNRFWWGNDFEYPMEMFNFEHEPGPKTLLNGQVIDNQMPDGSPDGDADVSDAIDNLMAHDNVAPFICRRLIQRLVKSNPSRAYIRRVSRKFNDNGQGIKGDMKAVVKAILLDSECWRGLRTRGIKSPGFAVEVIPRGTDYSKLNEPVIRYARLLRGVHATSTYPTGRMMVMPLDWVWIQGPFRQPTVFSFYLPDYQPPGDLVTYAPSRRIPNGFITSPEFQQKTSVTSNVTVNLYGWHIYSEKAIFNLNTEEFDRNWELEFNLDAEKAMATEDADVYKLVDQLDLVFCSGTIPQDYKELLVTEINQHTACMKNNTTWRSHMEGNRVQAALRTILTSPFCAISE